jgi:hypothetical protein
MKQSIWICNEFVATFEIAEELVRSNSWIGNRYMEFLQRGIKHPGSVKGWEEPPVSDLIGVLEASGCIRCPDEREETDIDLIWWAGHCPDHVWDSWIESLVEKGDIERMHAEVQARELRELRKKHVTKNGG